LEGGQAKILHCPAFGKTGGAYDYSYTTLHILCYAMILCLLVEGFLQQNSHFNICLAKDPKGRAFMISAIEKRKFEYVLNRDASGNRTIASPLKPQISPPPYNCN
jgi:hypothetical protein